MIGIPMVLSLVIAITGVAVIWMSFSQKFGYGIEI